MDILYLPQLKDSGFENGVWELCVESNKEFVPPLSFRESTTQSALQGSEAEALPRSYFEGLLFQKIIIAQEKGRVAAFMSFREGIEGFEDCLYVSTIITQKQYRGNRITEKMYKLLLEREKGKNVLTRTWSQNAAHLHVLTKLGFKLCKRLKDHRGAGIDTVYYLKENRS